MSTWPSLWSKKLGTPNDPAIRFTRGTDFVATMVRNCYGLSGCSPPWTDLTVNHFGHRGLLLPGFRQVRSPLPPLDITTTVTGLLCWRDSHPLEWQLASLHWTGRAHALNGSQSRMGLRRTRGARAMSRTTSAVAVSTIGIDTGKNTLHLIGLDERGTIVLREKLPRGRIGGRLAMCRRA
jgi:hypothetical protein